MNWNKRLLWLGSFVGLLTVSALANGPIEPPGPKGNSLLNWSGFYFGGNAGGIWGDYSWGDTSVDILVRGPRSVIEGAANTDAPSGDIITATVPPFSESTGGDFVGGVQGGYNHQFGSWVFGLEGDAMGLSLSASKTFEFEGITGTEGVNLNGFRSTRKAESDWLLTGRVRFGYAWQRLLFYGTGGVAISNISVETNDFASDAGPGEKSSSDENVVVGWTAGGGAEFAVSDAVSIGVEYRHTGFGDENFDFSSESRFMVHSTHVDLDSDQVTLRVNIRVDSLFHR